MITKYGSSTVVAISIAIFLIIFLSFFIKIDWIRFSIFAFSTIFFVFTLYFFRDPERTSPTKSNIIVSPADGKVLLIKEVEENEFLKEEAIQISVFMSPFNVHVNRIPISGKVEYVNYISGKFLAAFDDKADSENERNVIGINSENGKVLYTQVAGAFARRIVSDVNIGDNVIAGKRFGMIKFGSRSDIIVPKKWNPIVKVGDKITAGETILFELK
jgi:phosphatidylserine decarboxylase